MIIRVLLLWLIVYIYSQLLSEMRFRRVSAFFIVLATTVMVAHSIIPHHHDYGLITESLSQCRNGCEDCSLTGHPEGAGDDLCCALNSDILVPGKSDRAGEDLQDERPLPGYLPSLTGALLNPADPLSVSCCLAGTCLQENRSQYLFLLSNPRGLRAPPLS